MANDLNLCQFIGRLGADPESSYLPNGNAVTKIRVASGRVWKDGQGNKQEATEWVRATAFGKLAEIIAQHGTKGMQVYIAGRMQTREYEKEGQRHFSTEIILDKFQMLGSKPQGSGQGDSGVHQKPAPADDDDLDDCPF